VSTAARYREFCLDQEARVRSFAGDLFRAGDGEGALEMNRLADVFKRHAGEREPAPLRPIVIRRRRA
jgi:hypothetical protein